jgi:uncharacterized iron-regulated protein
MTEHFEDRVDGVEVQGHPSLTALVHILARAVARQQAREAAQAGGEADAIAEGADAEASFDDLGPERDKADQTTVVPTPSARIEGDSAVSRDDDDVM